MSSGEQHRCALACLAWQQACRQLVAYGLVVQAMIAGAPSWLRAAVAGVSHGVWQFPLQHRIGVDSDEDRVAAAAAVTRVRLLSHANQPPPALLYRALLLKEALEDICKDKRGR